MAMDTIKIDDFRGGLNKGTAEKINVNESAELQGFIHIENALQSDLGRVIWNGDPALDTTWANNGIKSFDIWQKTSQPVNNSNATTQTQWQIVKIGGALWAHFEVDANGAAYNSGTPIFKPIAVRTTGLEESMSSFGGYAYFANGADSMIRWDGRSYCAGLCSCAGGTTVTFQSIAKLATYDSVREGDTIFFYNATAWTLTAYYVASITDDTHLELTVAGPNTGGNTAYNIVGVHNAGIAKPTEQLTLGVNTSSWTMRTIDTKAVYPANVYSAIDTDSSGYPHIVYTNGTNDLKHAWWDGSVWSVETIYSRFSPTYVDMVIDGSNNIYVVFVNNVYWLSYVKYTAGAWTAPDVIVSETTKIQWPNIDIDSDGHVHVAWVGYSAATTRTLGYMEYTTSWPAPTTVVSSASEVFECSLCVDSVNAPHIAYCKGSTSDLMYTTLSGTWSAPVAVDETGSVGGYCCIKTTTTNKPIISYYDTTNHALKLATYTTSWATETVDSSGSMNLSYYNGMTLTTTDLPKIVYYTGSDLKYASWSPSAWTITTIDSAGDVGGLASIYLDGSNNAHVAYMDETNDGMKYATLASLGSDMSIGEYKYRYLYKNSNTTYQSALNDTERAITIADLNSTVDITLPATAQNPTDTQINQIDIYRTKANGELYYYLTTLNRSGATWVFQSGAWTDSNGDDELTLEDLMSTEDRSVPPNSIKYIREYNGRMYGWGDNTLRFSSLNISEYWPVYQFGTIDPLDIESYQTEGGFLQVGDSFSKILSVTPALGSDTSTSTRGSALLIQTGQKAFLWGGWDWSDFEFADAFSSSCVSGRTTENLHGNVVWLSRNGPMLTNGQTVTPIYEKLFPLYSVPFEEQIASAYLDKSVATFWRDWYICAYPATSATYNNRCFMYHVPSMTFTTLDNTSNLPTYSDFAVDSAGVLYAADATIGKIWKMFTKTSTNSYFTGTTGVACKWTSPIINLDKYTQLERIVVWTSRPSVDQTLTINYYQECASSPSTFDVTLAAAGSDGRLLSSAQVSKTAKTFQIGFSGTFTVPVTIYGIRFEYSGHGRADK